MPAIRDEDWFCSPTFQDGIKVLKEGTAESASGKGKGDCVRFSGLILGENARGDDFIPQVCDAIKQSKCKSVCLDWMTLNEKSLADLESLANDDATFMLDSFHLTMIELSTEKQLSRVASLVSSNKHIVDLILTFCSINDGNIGLLGKALEVNEVILSLNLNFNLLKRAGFLTLADSLVKNGTLRYLEAKMNKAEKADLEEFMTRLNGNEVIEYLDLGQADDIDGKISQNALEELPLKQGSKKSIKLPLKTKASTTVVVDEAPVANNNQANPAANNNNAQQQQPRDLFTVVKEFVEANKSRRKSRERQEMVDLLRRQILPNEAKDISASLKHCKILFLGEKGCGKSFFAHCLVHQLYQTKVTNKPPENKLKRLSHARVTELGWTRITDFQHVNLVLAKRLASEPSTIANRLKANEVSFQFPEEVVITKDDLLKPSVLDREDELLVQEVMNRDGNIAAPGEQNTRIFSESTEADIITKFENEMEDLLEKALRENNYPSFSLWDCGSPAGFDHFYRHFYNNHGLIFVFFSIEEVRNNPEAVVKSVLKYLQPIQLAKAEGKDFSAKVFLIGTFLDKVINEPEAKGLNDWVRKFERMKKEEGLDEKSIGNGHIDFLMENLSKEKVNDKQTILKVKKMLMAFNVELFEALQGKYLDDIISNDAGNLLFYPLSNNLPKSCEKLKHDFDDISGINKFRASVRETIDKVVVNEKGEEEALVPVLRVMKSLRVSRIIDEIVKRAATKPENTLLKTNMYMTYDEFQELAQSVGITAQSDILIILRYLDVTGIVSWKKANQTLEKMIILNPDYLIQGLENFYKAVGNPETYKTFHVNLDKEAKNKKMQNEVKKLRQSRIVTGDLLYEELVNIENPSEYEFFKEFLKTKLHLNRLNVEVLKAMFAKQNLLEESWFQDDKDVEKVDHVDEEYFIVPFFDSEDSKETLSTEFFNNLKLKYVPKNGIYIVGSFEKAFCSLLDALDGSEIVGSRVKNTKNSVEYGKHLAKFDFGGEIITLSKQTSKEEAEQSGYLQFDFKSASSVHLMMKFIESLFRKLNEDLVEGGAFQTYVLAEGTWVEIADARSKKLSPYFDKAEKTVSVDDVIANFDEI